MWGVSTQRERSVITGGNNELAASNRGHERYSAVGGDDIFINGDLAVDKDKDIGKVRIQSGVRGDDLLFQVSDGAGWLDLHADRIHPCFFPQMREKFHVNFSHIAHRY